MRFWRWFVAVLAVCPAAASGQAVVAGEDTVDVAAEPGDALGAARSLQARFERARERYFPLTFGAGGGPCDEVVRRFCTWFGEGEWIPTPEPEDVVALRAELLHGLDSLQKLIPTDDWVLGQRVWYRVEAGDASAALEAALGCASGASTWWCAALEGLALHALLRYGEAEGAFERSLALMDPELALEWRVPERAVDREARRVLGAGVTAADGTLDVLLDRLWWLSDPLYLVDGNDRMTAHFARWTVATLKDGARNPYRIRWGRDLEELTVRHGWEVGWERTRGSTPSAPFGVTGHKEQEGRDYLPSGSVLADPTQATPEDLVAEHGLPRSLYAPPYAPVLLPMDGQLAFFPRGERVVVVATHDLPEDTTFHAEHDHPRPWMDAGDQADLPDRIGLFAVPVDGGERVAAQQTGSATGALMIDLPAGAWLISAESWSPARRRAGRLRTGYERSPTPSDVATLSDVLLLEPMDRTPTSLEAALASALARPEIRPEESLAIAWEVSGLGFRDETLDFEVSVERAGRGLLRRLGEALRLTARPASMRLAWQEPAPERPCVLFRHLDLALPELDPGEYAVVLTVRAPGRSDAVTRRTFRVVAR